MKKRRFSFILAMIFVIPCLFFLSACGKDGGGGGNNDDPSKYTLANIERLTNEELSKNYNNISVKFMDYNIEVVKQKKDNKEYFGLITNSFTKEFTFATNMYLVVYKDANGQYYYAKKHYEKDSDCTIDNAISFTSTRISQATDVFAKDTEGLIEFLEFETYLYEKDGVWKIAAKYGDDYSFNAIELTTAQKKWLLREEVTKTKVGTDADFGGNYYKLTYDSTTNSDYLFIASEIENTGKYKVAIESYDYSEKDLITETSLIYYLNLFDGKAIEGHANYYYYHFESNESEGKEFNLGVYKVENNNYQVENDFYILDNGKYNKDHNINKFGSIGAYSSYDCTGKTYIVSDNGQYYMLTNYVNDSFSSSFFNYNEEVSFDKVRYDLTKSEYDAIISDFSNDSLKTEFSFNELDLAENFDEKDRIIALYGEDAYKFSFKMDDFASINSFTARIKSTVLNEYYYSDVNITDNSSMYYIENALIDQEIVISFVDQKLSSIAINWKLNDKFKLTNSENDTDKKFSVSNYENEKQIVFIEINKPVLNFKYPNLSEFRNDSMKETEDVEIELRNVYGENKTLSEINGEPIKAGMEINLSDIAVPAMPEGVVFDGWYLDFYFRVPAFVNGKLNVSKYEDKMVLFAKYKNLPKLTIELNGGKMTPFNLVTVRLGEMEDIIEMPYKKGYEFKGFYTDSELTKPYNYRTEDIVEDLTIYAGYTKLYVVKFNTNGGKEVGNVFVKEGEKEIRLTSSVEKIGYIFKGWKLAGSDAILNDSYELAEGVANDLNFEAVYEEGYVLKVYERLFDGSFALSRVITISKTCPENSSFEELCDNLKEMFSGDDESCKIFTDEALLVALSGWPTESANIYLSEVAD